MTPRDTLLDLELFGFAAEPLVWIHSTPSLAAVQVLGVPPYGRPKFQPCQPQNRPHRL
jgi:hypothetical protein